LASSQAEPASHRLKVSYFETLELAGWEVRLPTRSGRWRDGESKPTSSTPL
jgi:hypothetical protein